ncbi:ABC transporter substrate-binding protein, partial [Glutamicibacter halophytocola]|uniref:ABC transporter substrate-binding protein n=1 Tax=Glutamicibacter halophytocola TaxID=1933880 RepID=UPI001558FB65
MQPKTRFTAVAASVITLSVSLTGCAGAGGGPAQGGKDSINVLMVNNPQMLDLQKLTAEHFTKETGITVNFTVMPENDVRAKITQEFSWQSGQYDVASLSNYEIPFFAENGWLAPLDESVAGRADFDQDDILPAYTESLTGTDGHLYGEPFYGESSLTIYRKDLFEKHGLKMPDNPTWDEVAELAEKIDEGEPDMKGICLRGQPGWGQVFSPLTSVVNTFGGTWFDKDWNAQVNSPEFTQAVTFYTDLVREHGEAGAAQAGFAECLNNMVQSNTAMWYDASSAGSILEADDSPVKGKLGYAQAPVKETEHAGW